MFVSDMLENISAEERLVNHRHFGLSGFAPTYPCQPAGIRRALRVSKKVFSISNMALYELCNIEHVPCPSYVK